jgi:tetratricopeptide (TPR) repeat protein
MVPKPTGHPSSEELAALLRGGLAPPRFRAVLRHLLRPCVSCAEVALAALGIGVDLEAAGAKAAPEEYEAAIDRAFDVARRHARHLRGQAAQARNILKRLEREKDDLEAGARLPLTAGTYAKFRAFLERSWDLRFEDPGRMVRFALLAVKCAEQLDARFYGVQRVCDFQCEAQAVLGNAYRVAQQLDRAEAAMDRARQLFELGTRDPVREIHLLEREAALDAARRRFKRAIMKLETVFRYRRRHGDKHLAASAMIQQGLYMTYAGDPEKALQIWRRSLALIDASQEPMLTYAALHNQVRILCDLDRFHEAERRLFSLRRLQRQAGRLNELKLRWEEGRIDAGLRRFERAEKALCEAIEGMTAVNRTYDAALASLDLAAVLMALRRSGEAGEVVLAAYQTFVALRIEREAFASVAMLKQSFELGLATRAMVEEVAAFLRRFENDPSLRFEGRAWEDG